jgi:GTP cyclohydrolase I
MTIPTAKPSVAEAEEAVRTLIRFAGDNPAREGLKQTPQRVVKSYQEHFSGYMTDPLDMAITSFTEIGDYKEMVLLSGISFTSFCEHHMLPIIGQATIAYLPNKKVIGISKIARIVDVFAKRLQIQEKLTTQICHNIQELLQPLGVAVLLDARHYCMSIRGVHKEGTILRTTHLLGYFKDDPQVKQEWLNATASLKF